MSVRAKKIVPALKHGGYSAIGILPGESRAEFEKHHEALIAELCPEGALEQDIVAEIALATWRKKNLATIRLATLARQHRDRIRSERRPRGFILTEIDPVQLEEAMKAAEEQARKELGEAYELIEIGDTASFEALVAELEVKERLDTRIDKCLKRLLLLRGLKSIATSVSAPRIPGPSKAA